MEKEFVTINREPGKGYYAEPEYMEQQKSLRVKTMMELEGPGGPSGPSYDKNHELVLAKEIKVYVVF